MRKHSQFAFLYLQTFIQKHRTQLFISIILGFLSTLLFIKIYPIYLEFSQNKHQRVGVVGRFSEASLPLSIKSKIGQGLVLLTKDGEATSSIAKSWQIREEGKVYVMELNNDIFWHDEKLFSAGDVNYNMTGATFLPISDSTLKITLEEPFAPFLTLLTQPILRPNLMGTGLYKTEKIVRSGPIVEKIVLRPLSSKLSSITYKFYPNTKEVIQAFKMGEVDIIENISDAYSLKDWTNVKITETSLFDRYVGIFFNLKNELFKDKEIRQAFAYAIPELEEYEKAISPISPLSWAHSKNVRIYDADLEAAQEILGESKLSSPSSQIYLSTFINTLPIAEKIVEEWNKTGLNIKVKVENSIPEDYQIFLLTQIIPSDPDQYQYWQSTQDATNITHYNNQKIDKLLEDGRKTQDREERIKIYADFQKYLVDDAPVIFLYYPKMYTVERK